VFPNPNPSRSTYRMLPIDMRVYLGSPGSLRRSVRSDDIRRGLVDWVEEAWFGKGFWGMLLYLDGRRVGEYEVCLMTTLVSLGGSLCSPAPSSLWSFFFFPELGPLISRR